MAVASHARAWKSASTASGSALVNVFLAGRELHDDGTREPGPGLELDPIKLDPRRLAEGGLHLPRPFAKQRPRQGRGFVRHGEARA